MTTSEAIKLLMPGYSYGNYFLTSYGKHVWVNDYGHAGENVTPA